LISRGEDMGRSSDFIELYCPECGELLYSEEELLSHYNAKHEISSESNIHSGIRCGLCGTLNPLNHVFCGRCGAKLDQGDQTRIY
jgi:hypothetical protein